MVQEVSIIRLIILFLFLFSSFSYAKLDIEGAWQTNGYGYIFNVDDERVTIYEQTELSCIKSGLAAGSLIKANDKLFFSVSIAGFIDAKMYVMAGESESEKYFHRSDTSTYMRAQKLQHLPSNCSSQIDASAEQVVNVFKANFWQHYPFFDEKKVSWEFNQSTFKSETTLFSELVNLVAPLKDAHIALVAPNIDSFYFGSESLSPPKVHYDLDYLSNILAEAVHVRLGGKLYFSHLSDDLGYLSVQSFSGFDDIGGLSDLDRFTAVLNEVFTQFKDKKGLVIDIRNNTGGSDKLALMLASRLTDSDYLAYSKQAVQQAEGNLTWTEPQKVWVKAESSNVFKGNVVLITNRQTISAGETFVMALFNREPKVVRIGQRTAGHFSDMLPRTLPNGWLFALPNERYIDQSGNSYDISGISPDISIKEELATEYINRAISLFKETE